MAINQIQVQTSSFCNARCACCPYYRLNQNKEIKHGVMNDDLFKKIILDAKNNGIKRIIPYLMNEPLIDPHIDKRLTQIREIYPNAFIEFCTNALLLRGKKAESIAPIRIDEFRVSVIGADTEATMGIKFDTIVSNVETFRKIKNPNTNIVIVALGDSDSGFWANKGYRVISWGISSRAGNVSGDKIIRQRHGGCTANRHLSWLHILWDGNAVLCCMAWDRNDQNIILGDLSKQTIQELLSSEQYLNIVQQVNAPNGDVICNRCEWAK